MSPIISGGGGSGGSQPFPPPDGREFIGGQATVPGNFTHKLLDIGNVGGGPLLDYTDPTLPTIITAGLYAFFVNMMVNSSAAPGNAQATFNLDYAGADVSPQDYRELSTTSGLLFNFFPVYYLEAGMQLAFDVKQNSGGDIDAFLQPQSYIQRIW